MFVACSCRSDLARLHEVVPGDLVRVAVVAVGAHMNERIDESRDFVEEVVAGNLGDDMGVGEADVGVAGEFDVSA